VGQSDIHEKEKGPEMVNLLYRDEGGWCAIKKLNRRATTSNNWVDEKGERIWEEFKKKEQQ